MTNVSKKPLPKKQRIQLTKEFVSLFAGRDIDRSSRLFHELFTEAEEIMFIKRVAIIYMLSEGYTTYRISNTLKVSDVTVGRMRNELNKGSFKNIVSIFNTRSFNSERFWDTIEVLLRAGLPPRGKGRWRNVLRS